MDRIKNIGLSEQQQKAVRSLVIQGKIQVDSFAAFNDEDLAETLVDQITAPAPQGNHITITHLASPSKCLFLLDIFRFFSC
jgi:hypothetical protein